MLVDPDAIEPERLCRGKQIDLSAHERPLRRVGLRVIARQRVGAECQPIGYATLRKLLAPTIAAARLSGD